MSVLACDRVDCHEIMCSRLILDGTRYICESCWEELLRYKATWDARETISVATRLRAFMETSPGTYLNDPVDMEAEFQRLTEGRCG